jgi:prevent-host-death family protein
VTVPATAEQHGDPYADLYDPGVANTERIGVEAARKVLGRIVDKVKDEGVHTIIGKRGSDVVAIVPMDWYRRAREALGDPTDL